VASTHLVHLLECNRLGWREFERPVSLLLDLHDRANPPEACYGDARIIWVINSVWLNDPEIASELAQRFQLPTRTATFSSKIASVGVGREMTWSWASNGQDSQLVLSVPDKELGSAARGHYRYVWDHGAGISVMFWNETVQIAPHEPIIRGILQPPMTTAERGPAPFAGLGDFVDRADVEVEFKRYGDYTCESR
jgi:hypothetical protein